jgi:23S rRNA (adenine1618-N6)-methyltransferase
MVNESQLFKSQVCWFTTLVSKAGNLDQIKHQLKKKGVAEIRVVKMSQGVKIGRFIAWTFLDKQQQSVWAEQRWQH